MYIATVLALGPILGLSLERSSVLDARNMASTADTVKPAPEQTEKHSVLPQTAPPPFDAHALLAQHKDVAPDAKPKGKATLDNPDTASLYGNKAEAPGGKKLEAPDKPAAVKTSGEVPLLETQHTVAPHETIEQIARQKIRQRCKRRRSRTLHKLDSRY